MALENYFLNPKGLLALISLLILIALYLTHRKPKRLKFPSIIFFLGNKLKSPRRSFFKIPLLDFLFLLNFLALLLMSLSIAKPFLFSGAQAENPIILIDVSASMKAGGAFENSKNLALDLLSDKNTLIAYSDKAEVLGIDLNKIEAERLIRSLEVKDTKDDLELALEEVNNIAGNRKIFVLSDFRGSKSAEEFAGRAIFVPTSKNKLKNAGIINAEILQDRIKLSIKNYNLPTEDFGIIAGGKKYELKIGEKRIKTLEIKIPENVTEVKLLPEDDFLTDNTYYFVPAQNKKLKVLLITDGNPKFIIAALKAIPFVELEMSESIKVPNKGYDVIFIAEAHPEKLIRYNIKKIADKVRNGSSLIIYAWENITEMDFLDLLPVKISELKGKSRISGLYSFSKFDFPTAQKHFVAETQNSIPLAISEDNSTIIAYKRLKSGTIMYYGILDRYSNFVKDIQYPIFWKEVLKFITGYKDRRELNLKTGESFSGVKLDKVGIHEINGIKVSANLLDEEESDLESFYSEKYGVELQKGKREISNFLIIMVIFLLLAEILYLKYRGDL